ncbi:hypothetical protein ABPG74_009531 [Tetrahymena malaccensis]
MALKLAKTVLLNDGTKFPIFGLGTWQSTNQQEMTNLIRSALDLGYRHIDTAIAYENQKMIGDALKTIFSEGKYKREDLYIVSKIFPYKTWNTEQKIKQTLEELQIEYLDLFLLHWTFTGPSNTFEINHKPVHVIWAELEQVQQKGLTKSIGVSNFNVQSLLDLWSYAKVKPVANQVELHVFLQQKRLVEFCKRINVHVTAYSPLARFNEIVQNKTLTELAQKYNATVSQILLSFLLSQGISVIPKTEKASRLKENFESQDIQLSEEDIKKLKDLDTNTRVVQPADIDFFGNVPIFD